MLLKQYLANQGLSLEDAEVVVPVEPAEAIEASVDEVVAHGEQVDAAHAEIASAEEAVTSLESLVLTFESVAGERTALEKHLFLGLAGEQYAKIGLARPIVPTLESADDVTLSMEDFKETAKKVIEAIKAGWVKFKTMLREFWLKITDTAGRMKKKFEALLKDGDDKEVDFSNASLLNQGIDVGDVRTAANRLGEYLGSVTKKAGDIFAGYEKRYGTFVAKMSADGKTMEDYDMTLGDAESEVVDVIAGMKSPFDADGAKAEPGAVKMKRSELLNAGAAIAGKISDYHRDYQLRDKQSDELIKKWTDSSYAINLHRGHEIEKSPDFDASNIMKIVKEAARIAKRDYNALMNATKHACTQGLTIARHILVTVK